MNKKLFIFLAIAAIISSCGTPKTAPPPTIAPPPTSTPEIQPLNNPLPTVTPVCVSTTPTQKDMIRALFYIGDIFSAPQWEQIPENTTSIIWNNSAQGAIAYLETLIFQCGYEEPDLDKYFSNENWKAVFVKYDSYEPIDECKTDNGLRLYEFKAKNNGIEYSIKYWVKSDTDTLVIVTMLVFPVESKPLLDEYSSRLFPQLTTCSK
jgi:hypothetical protein